MVYDPVNVLLNWFISILLRIYASMLAPLGLAPVVCTGFALPVPGAPHLAESSAITVSEFLII